MNFEIIELEQRSEEWHKFRLDHIGSSDAAVIMGTSPWKSEYDLWLEKLGLKEPSNFISPAMQRGIDLEPIALKSFIDKMGIEMVPKIIKSKQYDVMAASLDGLCLDNQTFVEIKCPGVDAHNMALNGEIPRYYYAQIQHQLAVTRLPSCFYYSFDGKDGVCIEVIRSNTYIKELIQKEEEFWFCVQNFISPEQNTNHLQIEDPECQKLASRFLSIKNQIKELENEEKSLRDDLVSRCDQKNSIVGNLKLSKIVKKGNIDYGLIPVLRSVNLESYRSKPSEYWKLETLKM